MSKISEIKEKFKAKQAERVTQDTVKRAARLKALKEERTRLEGNKKIRDLEAQEKAKIEAAKGPNIFQQIGGALKDMRAANTPINARKGKNNGAIVGRDIFGGGAGYADLFGPEKNARDPFAPSKDRKEFRL